MSVTKIFTLLLASTALTTAVSAQTPSPLDNVLAPPSGMAVAPVPGTPVLPTMPAPNVVQSPAMPAPAIAAPAMTTPGMPVPAMPAPAASNTVAPAATVAPSSDITIVPPIVVQPRANGPNGAPGGAPAGNVRYSFEGLTQTNAPVQRPTPPSNQTADAVGGLQNDITVLRLQVEKSALERQLLENRQRGTTNAQGSNASNPGANPPISTGPRVSLQPTPAAAPVPVDPSVAERRTLPQVVEIRGARSELRAYIQTSTGSGLIVQPGDVIPNTTLKIRSISPRSVTFASQDNARSYTQPVVPVGATSPTQANAPLVRPQIDPGIATPIAR